MVVNKQNHYKNVDGLQRLKKANNKFNTTDAESGKKKELPYYDYGVRFHYWEHLKFDTLSWDAEIMPYGSENFFSKRHITQKYVDIKEELINNRIFNVNKEQFQILYTKAKIYHQLEKVKGMSCQLKSLAKFYDMYFGQCISVEHLIAMMVYCNHDTLQRKLSETFRRLDKMETIESVKRRHKNYYFLAKLLRECVECFGMHNPGSRANIVVFHGVNKSFNYPSIRGHVKCPFSTTTDFAVAVSFCQNQGMILEMQITPDEFVIGDWITIHYPNNYLSCMDMWWISDYPNEMEIFCVGGIKSLFYNSIIDVPLARNYSTYVRAVRRLAWNLTRTNGQLGQIDATPIDSQILFRLLAHELYHYAHDHPAAHLFESCPKYITRMVHSHCVTLTGVNVGIKDPVINYFFQNAENDWVNLELISILFPNVVNIDIELHNKDIQWFEQSWIYDSVISFIKNNKELSLSAITIHTSLYQDRSLVLKCIDEHRHEFEQLSWLIYLEDIEDSIKSKPNFERERQFVASNVEQLIASDRYKAFGLSKSDFKRQLLNYGNEPSWSIVIEKI